MMPRGNLSLPRISVAFKSSDISVSFTEPMLMFIRPSALT